MTSTGDLGSGPRDERAFAWLALPGAIAATVLLVTAPTYYQGDWAIATHATRLLFAGRLDVYSVVPEAQMGPLALVFAALPQLVYALLACSLLPVLLWVSSDGLRRSRTELRLVTLGGIFLAWPWAWNAGTGHVDDMLVAIGAAGIVAGLRRRTDWIVCAAFLLAIAGKPTAVVLLPLVLLASRRALLVSLAGMAAIWMPFALADLHGFLAAGKGISMVWPMSLPNLLGAAVWSPFPGWVRPVQLVGGLALVWWVGRHHGAAAAIVAVFAFRAILEPGAFFTYSAPVIAAGLMYDLAGTRRPVVSGFAVASFVVSYWPPMTLLPGAARIALLLAGLFIVMRPRPYAEPIEATQDLQLLSFVRARVTETRGEPGGRLAEVLLDDLELADEHDRDVLRFMSYRWRSHPRYPRVS